MLPGGSRAPQPTPCPAPPVSEGPASPQDKGFNREAKAPRSAQHGRPGHRTRSWAGPSRLLQSARTQLARGGDRGRQATLLRSRWGRRAEGWPGPGPRGQEGRTAWSREKPHVEEGAGHLGAPARHLSVHPLITQSPEDNGAPARTPTHTSPRPPEVCLSHLSITQGNLPEAALRAHRVSSHGSSRCEEHTVPPPFCRDPPVLSPTPYPDPGQQGSPPRSIRHSTDCVTTSLT